MQAIINPGQIQGSMHAPPSKSMMQRACAAALLHKGKTKIYNPGNSDDDNAALDIIQQLGAKIISRTANCIEIESNGVQPIGNAINCGESGLAARLFIPIAAICSQPINITGSGSLLGRTMEEFGNTLPALGIQLQHFEGHIPFTVQGPLQTKNISVDGSISSQFLSGMLFAYAFNATDHVTIHVKELKSKPYIDLTLSVLEMFGKAIIHDNYEHFHINPALFKEKNEVSITIEGDWSSASCLLVAGVTVGGITISGLQAGSHQADKKILDVLKLTGAEIKVEHDSLTISKTYLQSFEFNATDCPDLFPALSILAARCSGESYIYGIHRLWHKESNRIESITEMLHQFNIPYSIEDDALCIRGRTKFDYATIDPYNDHRIVMAAAIGALHAKGPVTILDADVVNKSYPDFFKQLISLGVNCTII